MQENKVTQIKKRVFGTYPVSKLILLLRGILLLKQKCTKKTVFSGLYFVHKVETILWDKLKFRITAKPRFGSSEREKNKNKTVSIFGNKIKSLTLQKSWEKVETSKCNYPNASTVQF